MRRPVLAFLFAVLLPVAALAQTAQERTDRLIEVTRLVEILQVMREEGLAYAQTMETDMFPGQGGAAWMAEAERIHDLDRALADMRPQLETVLADDRIDPALAFFADPLGQKIIAAELSARAAMLDDDVDAVAEATIEDMRAENDPRLDQLARFIAANDLLESNVVGGLNSNFAFYRGLADGGAFERELPESQMLAEVWAQEPELRADSESWLYSYLGLAYSALTDAELDAYIEISETEAGGVFNRAVFAAFDALFNRTSYELGLAAARFMTAEDA